MKDLARTALAVERRRRRMDRAALDVGGSGGPRSTGLADRIEQPPEHRLADRRADRRAERARGRPAPQPRGARRARLPAPLSGPRCCCTSATSGRPEIPLDRDRLVDRRQRTSGESDIDDRTVDRDDVAWPRENARAPA